MENTEWFQGRQVDEEVVHQRIFKVRVVLEAMAAGVALAFLLALAGCATPPPSASAKSSYDGPPLVLADDKGNSIKLTKAPCPNVSGWLAMSEAHMIYEGKAYKACWVVIGQAVVVFDANGDVTAIPASAFKPELGA